MFNLDSFDSRQEELSSQFSKLNSLELLIGEESNANEANITSLLKINRELRKQLESMNEVNDGAVEELNFLVPKINKLNDDLELAREELEKEENKLIDLTARINAEEKTLIPLSQRREKLASQFSGLKEEHQKSEEKWARLDQNFSSLKRIRQAAFDSYSNSLMSIMEEVVRPFDIFYGDSIDAEVESVAPNGQGFFSKVGEKDGMQSGFVFLVRSDDQWSEIPYYVRCTLAEKAYSFLEIISQKTNRNPPRIQSGEKLFLIRTAELSSDDGVSEENILSHHDL